MATRRELVAAIRLRYGAATRKEKGRILAELVAVAGYHRKHTIRVLTRPDKGATPRRRRHGRQYDEGDREALVALWEASDRICSKRLKPLIPVLLPALERHGRITLAEDARARALAHPALDEVTKARLRVLPSSCDPVLLLAAIRAAQAEPGERIEQRGATAVRHDPAPVNLDGFVASLATAWQEGEQRPTHKRAYRRRKPVPKRPSMLDGLGERIQRLARSRAWAFGARGALAGAGA